MSTIRHLLCTATLLTAASVLSAAVPGTINYQGRLTDAAGVPQPGAKAMSLKIYDAATAGTQLYSESIGTVTADANGVYAFQFGAVGTTDATTTEPLATTDGTTTIYQKTLSYTPVLPGTVSVTDGTFSWNETSGNPGSPATATPTVTAGFVIGAIVTNGGSGYATPPAVTILGNGTGATATATVTGGAVTEINIVNAGSGYTSGVTISISPPQVPFLVNYTGGSVTVTYNPAPPAGRTLTTTYRYSTIGIAGALAAGSEQWLELTVDGVAQSPRQKILAVPFAMNAKCAESAVGTLAKQINDLNKDLALMSGGISRDSTFQQNFGESKSSVVLTETTLLDKGAFYAPIHEQSSSVPYVGGSTSLSQNVADLHVRGVFYRRGAQGGGSGPGTVTFFYVDGTSSVLNLTITPSDKYQANPNPQKPVKRIDLFYQDTYSYGLWMTTLSNKSGVLALAIPTHLAPRSSIGLFIKGSIVSPGDLLSAQLFGTSGSQILDIDEYTPIQSTIGLPQKILLTFAAVNVNLEVYSSISGYVIRFAE